MDCRCHGEPMRFHKDSRYKRGGFFYCEQRKRERDRERYATEPLYRIGKQMRHARWQRSRRVKHPAPNPKMAALLAVTRRS